MAARTGSSRHISLRPVASALGALILASALAAPATASTADDPGASFVGAFFPTQSYGNRGTDVRAIQLLLNHRGISVATTGVFGSSTRAAVQTFQSRAGLPTTGIVSTRTWEKLVAAARLGSDGSHVRAIQTLLNEKLGTALPVTGYFGTATRSAVLSFQAHSGLTRDGAVTTTTWRNLVWHYEYPAFALASLSDYTDSAGNGPAANWGTSATIGQIEAAARSAYAAGLGPVAIGDISFEHGGDIAGHQSHEVGLDVDIRPVRRDRQQAYRGTYWYWESYDRAATRELVKRIPAAAPGHVKLIYFNDPVLVREGLTTSYPNHDGHLHIRYGEAVHPNPLYDL